MMTDEFPCQGRPMFRPCDSCGANYTTVVAAIWFPTRPDAPIQLMPAVLTCSACS